MGAYTLLLVAVFAYLASSTAAPLPAIDVFHVAGKVLCQDCSQGWNEWVNGTDPIRGSKVSVTCMDERNRVIHYASDLTDAAGNFDIACNKFVKGKKVNPQNCFLRLVDSPDPICNIATNFAGGKTGVKLHRPTVVYRDLLKYVLGNFYYTTPMCDEPDTTPPAEEEEEDNTSDEGQETNY